MRNYRTGLLAQVQRRFTPARTDARGPARLTHRFRLCVRSTLCWPRSPRAAPFPPPFPQPHSGLVRRLRRYYEAVRLPTTVHLGRAASAFPERPAPFPVGGQSWDLPVLAHEESAHAQVLRPRGSASDSRITPPAMLPSACHDDVGTPIHPISRLNSWPVRTPVQRFAAPSRVANAWLGATVGRYSFGVGLFHPHLHAGLSRRFP